MNISQGYMVLTEAQKNACVALNDTTAAVEPTIITGQGANLYGFGTLTGKYALPVKVRSDPQHARLLPIIGEIPIWTMDSYVLTDDYDRTEA